MKLYLSSYKLGDDPQELVRIAPTRRLLYVSNALDWSDDLVRREKSELSDIESLESLGFEVVHLDLRDYFDKPLELSERMLFVRGGNVFVLLDAMRRSGLDRVLKEWHERDDVLYAGYSAGICVLGSSLEGFEMIDDPTQMPYGPRASDEPLGILPFAIVPHYRSNHPESDAAERLVAAMRVPFRALRDGEVIIADSRAL